MSKRGLKKVGLRVDHVSTLKMMTEEYILEKQGLTLNCHALNLHVFKCYTLNSNCAHLSNFQLLVSPRAVNYLLLSQTQIRLTVRLAERVYGTS